MENTTRSPFTVLFNHCVSCLNAVSIGIGSHSSLTITLVGDLMWLDCSNFTILIQNSECIAIHLHNDTDSIEAKEENKDGEYCIVRRQSQTHFCICTQNVCLPLKVPNNNLLKLNKVMEFIVANHSLS